MLGCGQHCLTCTAARAWPTRSLQKQNLEAHLANSAVNHTHELHLQWPGAYKFFLEIVDTFAGVE